MFQMISAYTHMCIDVHTRVSYTFKYITYKRTHNIYTLCMCIMFIIHPYRLMHHVLCLAYALYVIIYIYMYIYIYTYISIYIYICMTGNPWGMGPSAEPGRC